MTDPSEPVLAIDIGGTKIAFADVCGDRVGNRRQIPTPRNGGDALIDAIAAEIARAGASAIAVATTGIVSNGTLTALNPVTLPIEDNYPLAQRLEARTGLTPLVINDAQAAAWGEYRFGAGQGYHNMMFVTVSTGVGGGLILDGNLQIGGKGLAGHIGHMTILGGNSACGCGRRGCLETVASGTAIARRYSDRVGRTVAAPAVFTAAKAGDGDAESILKDAAQALAETFANVTAAIDLDCIVLGGGVGLADSFLARVVDQMGLVPLPFQRPIVTAKGGADAGMTGVADLLMKKNFIK